ncbi:hypothetical protein TIFTF001_032599 [Ficus carica]|uniref:Uncharacterized protein n=1 Tax=Ficus carica TaxID=3494 RepID=A0AA88E3R1_FICCA|nr:hypothetical protein TIFTF001_032599 [Ficus carica]
MVNALLSSLPSPPPPPLLRAMEDPQLEVEILPSLSSSPPSTHGGLAASSSASPTSTSSPLVKSISRKPCPCVGNPIDVVSSDLLFTKKPSVKSKELKRSNNGGARSSNRN